MTNKSLLLTVIAVAAAFSAEAAVNVTGPDGKLVVTTDVAAGVPQYSVTYDGKQLIEQSPLGFVTNIGDFSRGMTMTDSKTGNVSKSYNQDRIKKSHVDYNANTLVTTFKNEAGQEMSVEWQVSDNDVAFRYIIPRQKGGETGSLVMEKEATGFKFPSYTTTFITPQSHAMIGWKRTKPSYEEPYKPDAPMTEKSMYGHGYTFPALFHVGDDGWVLLTETGVDGSYCGSRLSDYNDGMYTIAYPMPEENNGNGSASPGIALPGTTPWRTITVGSDLAPIVETTIPWSVVEPLYEATEPFKPGRGTWSWILWQDNSINYDDQVKFIDLAAEMGYENVLVDNWWDTNIGREGIEKLVKYAHSKGVNLLMWYSSSGWWNDIVQGPTSLMSRPIPRKKEMKWLHDLGIKGIKVDFFGGDKQHTMQLYEDILYDANDFGLQVVFHGCTLPRGWERMYPNFVASEAVLASENVYFSDWHANREAFDLTLHPFCRNAVAAMDWGGTIMNRYMSRDNRRRHPRRTTDVFEMAAAIVTQTSVQCIALQPNNLDELPAAGLDFLRSVPTAWDETRLIDGYPGRYVVMARRSGDRWYVAGLNATARPLTLTLDLPMMAGKAVSVYSDKPAKTEIEAEMTLKEAKVSGKGKLKITMQPNGGAVVM